MHMTVSVLPPGLVAKEAKHLHSAAGGTTEQPSCHVCLAGRPAGCRHTPLLPSGTAERHKDGHVPAGRRA